MRAGNNWWRLLLIAMLLAVYLRGCECTCRPYERRSFTRVGPATCVGPVSRPYTLVGEIKRVEQVRKPTEEELKAKMGCSIWDLGFAWRISTTASASQAHDLVTGHFTGDATVEGQNGSWYILRFEDGKLVEVLAK